jgi:hypothetical protein
MKAKKPITIERNNRIKARYETLDSKNMYRDDYIFGIIAKEFFLSPVTVENIVFNRV